MFLIISFASSISHSLTDKNSASIIINERRLPVFVEVWDPWCAHCQKFAPIWESLANQTKYEQQMIFATINCGIRTRKTCNLFPGTATPRFFWIAQGNSSVNPYIGDYSLPTLQKFIEKQLAPPTKELFISHLEEIIETSNDNPLFIFNISRSDQYHIGLANTVARNNQAKNIQFYIYYDDNDHLPLLHSYSSRRSVNFTSEFNLFVLDDFIKLHSIPFYSEYDSQLNYYIETFHERIMIFLQPQNEMIQQKSLESAQRVEALIATSHTKCDLDNWICRFVGHYPGKKGKIIILDRDKNYFWVYKKEIEPEIVYKWAIDVLTRQKSPHGPGSSYLLNFWFNIRANGGFHYYILFIPISLVSFLFLMIIYTTIEDFININREKNDLHKKQ